MELFFQKLSKYSWPIRLWLMLQIVLLLQALLILPFISSGYLMLKVIFEIIICLGVVWGFAYNLSIGMYFTLASLLLWSVQPLFDLIHGLQWSNGLLVLKASLQVSWMPAFIYYLFAKNFKKD